MVRPNSNEQNRHPAWEIVEMLDNIIDGMALATTSAANSTATGIIDALNETVECPVSPGAGTVGCQLTGTWAAAGDLIIFEGTTDGTNWVGIYTSMGTSAVIITGQNGIYQLGGAGYVKVRARGYSWGAPGNCTVSFNSTVGSSAVLISTPLPQGDNILGKVNVNSSLVPIGYDYVGITYTGDNATTIVYKTGGSGGTTVGTLTLAYTGTRLDSITKT